MINKNLFYNNLEKKKRKNFLKNEIFFNIYPIFLQTKYSLKLKYFNYKRRLFTIFFTKIKNRCILTNNPRTVYYHLRVSKMVFSKKIYNMPGFYRAI